MGGGPKGLRRLRPSPPKQEKEASKCGKKKKFPQVVHVPSPFGGDNPLEDPRKTSVFLPASLDFTVGRSTFVFLTERRRLSFHLRNNGASDISLSPLVKVSDCQNRGRQLPSQSFTTMVKETEEQKKWRALRQ